MAKSERKKTRQISKLTVGKVLGYLTEKKFRDGKYVIMVATFEQDAKEVIKTKTTGIKVSDYLYGSKKVVEKMLGDFLTAKDKELTEQSQLVTRVGHFNPRTASVFDYLAYYQQVRQSRLDMGVNSLGTAHYERGFGFIESLRRFFTERLQRRDMPLLEFKREHLLAYFDSLYVINARGVMNSASTVRHYYDYFLPAFRYAFENFLIPIEITRGIKKPKVERREMPYLTKDEIIRFLNYTNNPKYEIGAALQVLVLTGARRSELLALRFEDIDYDKKLIHVRRKVLYEKGGELKFYDRMKNTQSNRTIPLSNLVESIIAKVEQGSRTTNYKEFDAFIFKHANGKLIRPDELTKGIKDICRAADVTEIHLHSLRHSFANLSRQCGVTEEIRSAFLGHATKNTTGRYSNHIELHEKSQAMDKIIAHLGIAV